MAKKKKLPQTPAERREQINKNCKKWKKKNKEHVAEYQKEYMLKWKRKNADRIREYNRAYYAFHSEHIQKLAKAAKIKRNKKKPNK